MRKLMMVLGLVVVLVPLFAAAAALAAQGQLIQCRSSVPCYGGGGDDKLLERIGNRKDDVIVPRGGNDRVLANKYTNDTDVVRGGGGSDGSTWRTATLSTRPTGAQRRDLCIVDSRKEVGTSCFSFEVRRWGGPRRRWDGGPESYSGPRSMVHPRRRTP